MKKAIFRSFWVLLLGSFNLFTVCNKCDEVKAYYVFTNMNSQHIKDVNPLDDTYDTLTNNDSVAFEDWYILINGESMEIAQHHTKEWESIFSHSALYALSCVSPGENGLKSPLMQIKVFTDSLYNSAFPKESEITEIIRLKEYEASNSLTEEQFFQETKGKIYSRQFFVQLAEPPIHKDYFTFTIELTFSNGKVEILKTDRIKLIP